MENPKTLRLPSTVLQEVYAHASRVYPREGCGLLIGRREEGAWRAEAFIAGQNLAEAQGQERYVLLDPKDRLRAEAQARQIQGEVICFYHSHSDQPVYFSKADVDNSEEVLLGEPWVDPAYAYLVVSVEQGKAAAHGGFRILDGKSDPIEVVVF